MATAMLTATRHPLAGAPLQGAARPIHGFPPLLARLEQGLASIRATVLERCLAVADPSRDPGEIAALVASELDQQLRSLGSGAVPRRAAESAAEALSAAGGLQPLLAVYRFSHRALWDAWFALVEESPRLDRAERRELLARGSDILFRYEELLSRRAADAHQRQQRLQRDDREGRLLREVTTILDGKPSADTSLAFDLDRHHLGLIVWGGDPAAASRALAAALHRPLLIVSPPGSEQVRWAWVSGTRPLSLAQEKAVRDFTSPSAAIAIGLEGHGETGFRATHRQAQRARALALDLQAGAVRFQDIALEALLGENETDAHAFVAHELRGIEDDSSRSQEIRDTLAAYFAAECNAASAGARLGVHQQTVANRLRAAEERLGHHSIGLRRVELEVALRLRDRLATTPD